MVTLTDRDDGRRISVRSGDVVELRLAEIAAAGYRWSPERYDEALLELVDSAADYAGGAVGSAGQALFRFRVLGAGIAKIVLGYGRSWEDAAIKRFAITLDSVA